MTKKEIANILNSIATEQVYLLIVAEVPFLGLPIIGGIVKFVVGKILQRAIEGSVLVIGFGYIDFTRFEQSKEFLLASRGLKDSLLKGDKNEIERANKHFNDVFDRIMHFRH
jgi:hypothetical protein